MTKKKNKDTIGMIYYKNGKKEEIVDCRTRFDDLEMCLVAAVRTESGSVYKFKSNRDGDGNDSSIVFEHAFVSRSGIEYYPADEVEYVVICR